LVVEVLLSVFTVWSVLWNAFLIARWTVRAAKMVVPVIRKETAMVTSCLLRFWSSVWNERNAR